MSSLWVQSYNVLCRSGGAILKSVGFSLSLGNSKCQRKARFNSQSMKLERSGMSQPSKQMGLSEYVTQIMELEFA